MNEEITRQRGYVMSWSIISNCEYPCCNWDEAAPVWVIYDGTIVEAWYSNPSLDEYWFESDTGEEIEADCWCDRVDEVKPEILDNI